MTSPIPGDTRLFARAVLTSIEGDGGLIVLIGYSDGSVSLATDDVVPPATVADVLRRAADLAEQQPNGNQ